MSKVWLVARHQFREEASKRSFLLILLMLPLFMTFTVGFGYLISLAERNEIALGYVDPAGIVVDPSLAPDVDDVSLVPYASANEARAALESGQIDAYYLIDPKYAANRRAELIFQEDVPGRATHYFEEVIRFNLVADQAPAVAQRMLEGAKVTIEATDYGREFGGDGPSAGLFVPLVAAVIFAFLIMTTSGYMTSVLAEEKANRTIEIVVTSISSGRLMAGKVLGALGIALVQLLVWVLFLLGAIWVGANLLDIGWLKELQISWRDVLGVVAVALPAYVFVAALMALIGSMLSDATEAEQIGPMSMLLIFLPIYLLVVIFNNPNGAVALILSFFPPTSLVTIALRSAVMVVPEWQIALSALISLAGGVFLVWLAGRAFRRGMLRYGQRLTLRELFRRQETGQAVMPVS